MSIGTPNLNESVLDLMNALIEKLVASDKITIAYPKNGIRDVKVHLKKTAFNTLFTNIRGPFTSG